MFMLNIRDLKAADTPLPAGFQPGEYDVICDRGKVARNHIGNLLHFQETINDHVETYVQCQSRGERSLAIIDVVDIIRSRTPNGGFVKFCNKQNCYVEIGGSRAREKVGNVLRQAMKNGKNQRTTLFSTDKSNKATKKKTTPDVVASCDHVCSSTIASAPHSGSVETFRLACAGRPSELIKAPVLDSTEFLMPSGETIPDLDVALEMIFDAFQGDGRVS